MKINAIELVIATRELTLPGDKAVTVSIGRPEKFPDSDDFYCPYHISGMGDDSIRYAVGTDTVQSLYLALNKIGAFLYTSDSAQSGQLLWNGEKNLGFPVPDSIRDLLPSENT